MAYAINAHDFEGARFPRFVSALMSAPWRISAYEVLECAVEQGAEISADFVAEALADRDERRAVARAAGQPNQRMMEHVKKLQRKEGAVDEEESSDSLPDDVEETVKTVTKGWFMHDVVKNPGQLPGEEGDEEEQGGEEQLPEEDEKITVENYARRLLQSTDFAFQIQELIVICEAAEEAYKQGDVERFLQDSSLLEDLMDAQEARRPELFEQGVSGDERRKRVVELMLFEFCELLNDMEPAAKFVAIRYVCEVGARFQVAADQYEKSLLRVFGVLKTVSWRKGASLELKSMEGLNSLRGVRDRLKTSAELLRDKVAAWAGSGRYRKDVVNTHTEFFIPTVFLLALVVVVCWYMM